MKRRVLIVALITLSSLVLIGGLACKQEKPFEKLDRLAHKAKIELANNRWTAFKVLLRERGIVTPYNKYDFSKYVKKDDVGKNVFIIAGPVGGDQWDIARFRECLNKGDAHEAGRMIDDGLITWLKYGQEVELVALLTGGVAIIRPPGAVDFQYALDWSLSTKAQ